MSPKKKKKGKQDDDKAMRANVKISSNPLFDNLYKVSHIGKVHSTLKTV